MLINNNITPLRRNSLSISIDSCLKTRNSNMRTPKPYSRYKSESVLTISVKIRQGKQKFRYAEAKKRFQV